jgi:effector-binding domain-containing protein
MTDATAKWSGITLAMTALVATLDATAYEQAFSMTPVDMIEIRTLPAARLLATEANGEYFERSDGLFKRLFEYISDNNISMTVPVEGQLDRAEMRFYLGRDVAPALDDTDSVRVMSVPSRRVVSIGGKGSYTESNVRVLRERLQSWLEAQHEWRAAGDPYAVFWNGPFTPWFMKRFEVHIPLVSNSDR